MKQVYFLTLDFSQPLTWYNYIPDPYWWVRLLQAHSGSGEEALRTALEEAHFVIRWPQDWKGILLFQFVMIYHIVWTVLALNVHVVWRIFLLLSNHRWLWSTVLLLTPLWMSRTVPTSLLPSAPTKISFLLLSFLLLSSPTPSLPLSKCPCNRADIFEQIMLLVAHLYPS